jgi:hypothetical protein
MAVVIDMNIQFIADLADLENSKFKVMFIIFGQVRAMSD